MKESFELTQTSAGGESAFSSFKRTLTEFAYGFFVLLQVIGLSAWDLFLPKIGGPTSVLALSTLLMVVLLGAISTWTISRMVLVAIVLALSFIYIYLFRNSVFLFCLIAILAGQGFTPKRLIKTDLYFRGFGVALIVTLSFLGILPMSGRGEQLTGNFFTSFSYGFLSPNTLGFLILIVGLDAYLHVSQKWQKVSILVLALFFESLLKYLTGILGVMTLIIVSIFFHKGKSNQTAMTARYRIFCLASVLFFLFATFGSCYIAKNYNSTDTVWNFANKLFSLRFPIWQYYYEGWPPSLFGNIIYVDQSTVGLIGFGAFDGSYLYFLLKYGWVAISIILLAMIYALKHTKDYFSRRILVLFVAVTLVTGIPETPGFLVAYSPFFLLLGSLFINSSSKGDPAAKELRN